MRDVLTGLTEPSEHFGQSYDLLAPTPKPDASYDPDKRNEWLGQCVSISVSSDYRHYFNLWKDSFSADDTREFILQSRLLIGHGNPSGSEVGLTVHRTWGAPMISGSALKGLTASYTHNVYGKEDCTWCGQTWDGRRIVVPAGENYAIMFGSPDVDGHKDQERQGLVTFHDALYMPPPFTPGRQDTPFVRDVLTPHQSDYYRNAGADWPNDWTSPVPVSFVTVKPGTKFLLAISGPDGWRKLAMRLVTEALEDWGAGAKTSLGYGRLFPEN